MVRRQGAILLIVLIVLLTISLLGVTMMALFFSVFTSSQTELDRARALYLAEAGIAQALNALQQQAGVADTSSQKKQTESADSNRVIPRSALSNGYFEVYNDFSQSVIISTGSSNNVRRTLQVKYNVY